MQEQMQETNTKDKPKYILWDAFLIGFASTAGMMAALGVWQNRYKIQRAFQEGIKAIAEAR